MHPSNCRYLIEKRESIEKGKDQTFSVPSKEQARREW